MNRELVKINVDDTEKIWRMQIDAFRGLLDLYQDFDTSPGNETTEKVKMKLLQDYCSFSLPIAEVHYLCYTFNS